MEKRFDKPFQRIPKDGNDRKYEGSKYTHNYSNVTSSHSRANIQGMYFKC